MAIWNYQTRINKLPQAKIVQFGNTPINIIHPMGIITHLHCSRFQVLLSVTTILHSTRHTGPNQALVTTHNYHHLSPYGKGMNPTKAVVAGNKFSLLHHLLEGGP